ncbi:Ribosomal protein L7Ae/L30e/S12e/Gadd45 family protein [Giardia muris]|uniref:Ribosomal protein L7Ae/L30e/S12e/Gadd45 family protein n=1 Tax=Giardia muris TaxID=5742 RepID=A0A4Z1T5P0_GIAMU|nr:Ribosomal protein L7Ae/L30e/S12e/Gadd45 family protein [Giardia muris]|eukprot:TNJ27791.1 Ribosomal protein L7Ae/L30e/S12e/Gadd45 family protein [Giardia muris]
MPSDSETSNESQNYPLHTRPLAERKFERKALKLAARLMPCKSIGRGVKEVSKLIRRGQHGICLIAADTYPVTVYAHLPVLCERNDVPYCFVRSKRRLADLLGTGQSDDEKKTGGAGCSVVLILEPTTESEKAGLTEDDRKDYEKLHKKASEGLRQVREFHVVK